MAREQLEAELVEIWEDILGLSGIRVNDDFWDLGGTSIQGLKVIAEISVRLRQEVPPTTMLQATTVASLAARMIDGEEANRLSSLTPIQRGGSMVPFFCVHGGDGGVFFVRNMSTHMDPDRPVYGLQTAGFDQLRPSVYLPIEELAANYISELRTVQPEGPYLLGGLSFGGLVAWQMGHQLTEEGHDVALVVLLDTKSSLTTPWTPREAFRRYRSRLEKMTARAKVRYLAFGVFRRLWRWFRLLGVRISVRQRHRLPSDLRNFHYSPLHARAAREFELRPYKGRVMILSEQGAIDEQREFWGPLCKSELEIYEIPADHLDMFHEPHVRTLATHLEASFEIAVSSRS